MRGGLLRLLKKTAGQNAYELLIKMANEASVRFYKDYLYWLALCRAEKDTEIAMEYTQWSEKNIPDFAKDVRKAIGCKAGFVSYDQLRDDLITIALIETNSRNAIAKESEDETNDRFRNALLHKGYLVADQSRGGESQSGINAGERDLVIHNTEGVDESIIEAFVLKSLDTHTIDGHYNKLTQRYDTVGCATNFILVYAKTKNFDRLWEKYQAYKTFRNFTDTKNKYSKKGNIRIGTSDENGMVIYHLVINFYSHGKSTM